MPELPEVETTCRGIAPVLCGQTVVETIVRCARLRWPISSDLAARLHGRTLRALSRRGKYLQFIFDHGTMLVHLGMSGSLRVYTTPIPAGRHDHVEWHFSGGVCLRLRDPRRFGAVLWVPVGEVSPLLQRLGVEPLTQAFTPEHLWTHCRGREQALKVRLMDNAVVVGVGNIYANESLFQAGMLPCRAAKTVTLIECERLVPIIQHVLASAIVAGGSTLRDYVGGDGAAGYFQQQHFVYGRAGQACLRCGTTIEKRTLGQRGTFFCPHCQT